jgi:peptidylprolyl isomerase
MYAVSKGDFVVMEFSGKDQEGQVVISSDAVGQEDFAWQIGHVQQLPPGLHDLVVGMDVGQSRSATVPAAQAMGEQDEKMVFEIPREVCLRKSGLNDCDKPQTSICWGFAVPDTDCR